jgi:hypothetical protein
MGWRNLVWEARNLVWVARNLVWEARRRHLSTRTATAAMVSVATAMSVAISLRVGRTGTKLKGGTCLIWISLRVGRTGTRVAGEKTFVPRCQVKSSQANRRRSRHQSA